MRHFGKRGMDDKLAFIMWEIMVILMVVIALTISVKGIANNTTYWKKYHSADLALMTDLMLVNQGDFEVNYDMKELKSTTVSKILGIDKLVFQTALSPDAYFLYSESMDKDRFPQSYIFAKTDPRVKIISSDTTSSYVVLNKRGDTFSMTQGKAASEISCPALDTAVSLSTRKINVVSISDTLKDYSASIDTLLLTTAQGQDNELLIILSESKNDKNRIYYDTLHPEKSQKMSCLIRRQILNTDASIELQELAYDNTLDNYLEVEPVKTDKSRYSYWVLIELNKKTISKDSLSSSINGAIKEYYGLQI